MKESKTIIIITILFLVLGSIALYFSIFSTKFNFYKSELTINELEINEKLSYRPDQNYHTLYRNFNIKETPTTISPSKTPNGITVSKVNCEDGTPYLNNFANYCYLFDPIKKASCLPYTESNEYGCTFGNEKGFEKGKDYEISSNYILNPSNLFKINNKYYIKFIAYSKNQHKTLTKGKNLIINKNAITKTIYLPMDDVIIYIPYTKDDIKNYNIVYQSDFLFDTNYLKKLLLFLLAFSPAIFLLASWYFYVKEKTYLDVPKELSSYPQERKAWEVAAYFHPPFSVIDKEFFSALLLDLYRRKLIDLKLKEKNVYVKINENPPKSINKKKYPDLDEIEIKFISIIKELKERSSEKYLEEDYVNLKSLNSFLTKIWMQTRLKTLQKNIQKTGKTYIEDKGYIILNIVYTILLVIAVIFGISYYFLALYFIIMALFSIIYKKSALLISFKESYYQEYQQWQAFRKYLSNSYSIRNMPHGAVILWEQYLVYGCALGESKKVLKELKQANIITIKEYTLYNTSIITGSHNFASASGTSGKGGGFGGAGGGGIGGGGGGGR